MTHIMTHTRRTPCAATGASIPGSWCCPRCGKLLGIISAGEVHIRFSRAHEYVAALPATCICRGCGTLSRRDRF